MLIGVVGRNVEGQCGLPHQPTSTLLQLVPIHFPHSIKQIDCGYTFSSIVTDRGQVYTAGLNTKGQTGAHHGEALEDLHVSDDNNNNGGGGNDGGTVRHMFRRVRGVLEHETVDWIACGALRTFFVVNGGYTVYGVGSNSYSQLGLESTGDYFDIQKLRPFYRREIIRQVGERTEEGSNELGDDPSAATTVLFKQTTKKTTTAQKVEDENGDEMLRVTHIGCSYSFTTFVCNNRHVFISGQNWLHTSRTSVTRLHVPFDDLLLEGEHVVQLTSGSFHCMILTSMGRVFSGGECGPKLAQVGPSYNGFRLVTVLGDKRAKLVRCKCDISVIVTTDNDVYLFMTQGKQKKYSVPTRIEWEFDIYQFQLPYGRTMPPVIDVAMGRDSVHVVTQHEIFSAGKNESGELNLGELNKETEVSVARSSVGCPIVAGATEQLALACGEHHTIVYTVPNNDSHLRLFFTKLQRARVMESFTDVQFVFA